MTDIQLLRTGHDAPSPARASLRAGPLALVYEDGDLRYIKLGDREVVRRIYVAVRDQNWGTVAGTRSGERVQAGNDTFTVTYTAEHRQGNIAFAWDAAISGAPDGTITFSLQGEARTTFLRNRIGFCVLHPIGALAGAACVVEHVDGTSETTQLPIEIVPDQPVEPFSEMRALRYEIRPGLWAEMQFSGDMFEIEDQRNWTDDSLKTFCTPLRLPYPVEIAAGTRIAQTVTLRLLADTPAATRPPDNSAHTTIPPLVLSVDAGSALGALPWLGLGVASHGMRLSDSEIEQLRALHLAHLRVDLDLATPDFVERLELAADEAHRLGVALEAALLLPDEPEELLDTLCAALDRLQPLICRWLVFHRSRQPTPDALLAAARARLSSGVPIGAGSNSDFFLLNRGPMPREPFDQVSFAINPQVHAFDNASLVETLQAQAVVVANARRLAAGRPVVVSPVTLKPCFNPYATGEDAQPDPNALPPQVDVRQMSLFGAAWTLGSIKYLAESGAASVTFFETTGWRGVLESERGSPFPQLFRSHPGQVFPLYFTLADVGELAGGQVCAATSSDPLRLAGLALRHDGRVVVLLANLTAEPQTISVRGLPATVAARVLDEITAGAALADPAAFRAMPGTTLATRQNVLRLELRPYALARLFWE